MMKIIVLALCWAQVGFSQNCANLNVSFKAFESRCAATGAIKISVSGGSGNYIYKAEGHVVTNFTSTDSITGLSAGPYTVTVTDVTNACTNAYANVVVPGTYSDPRFTLSTMDVSCDNGSNGSVSLLTREFGRAPFTFSIVAPSTAGIGTSNNTGNFSNLKAGNYTIRLTDSCGGIQTRLVTINNYTWWIDYYLFTKFSCDSARGFIRVLDSKGNNSLVGSGIAGMQYGIVRSPGDTIWSNSPAFSFPIAGQRSFVIVVKDKCGIIKKGNASVSFIPTVGANVNTSNFTCSTFNVALNNVFNFFSANYCLFDAGGLQLACNGTGQFNNLAYGDYCIKVRDACTDTVITRCFSVTPPPISVGNNVSISNKTCYTFRAAITGSNGLSNPQYCLKDSVGNVIACNGSGVFNQLTYGYYCIEITDGCRDTTFTRCFNPARPRPSLPSTIAPAYTYCNGFGLAVRGDSLFSPRFCLYDSLGQELYCNATGIFDSLSFGNYCVQVYDSCYDTTIVRCLNVLSPTVINDLRVAISNRSCSTFSVNISSVNLFQPTYCLYNSADSQIVCNTTGVFDAVPNGTYCIKSRASCPDTIFTNCFTVTAPRPSINNSIRITNKTCTGFTAAAYSFTNLNNPQFCLFNSNNVQIACNTTGEFTNVGYGSYCMIMRDGCYDTSIRRCFSVAPSPINLSVSASGSCNYGYAKLRVSVTGGTRPIGIKIYNFSGAQILSGSFTGTALTYDNLPGSTGTQRYKVIATDLCGVKDTFYVAAPASSFVHLPSVRLRCPSATWQNGSGYIVTRVTTNMGALTVRIIKKNNVTLATPISPSVVSGSTYTFNDLGPGTYIVRYKANDNCNKYLYDTLTIAPYQYPILDRTSAYQCDSNGFSVGAVVTNGVPPFAYEIIGSTPAFPSINAAPQPSPIFSINNGTSYSFVRLRVIDACGNASLEDASILPLANSGISATYNCFQLGTRLSIDSIYNSTFRWYRRSSMTSTDSTYLGSGTEIQITNLLPTDTGWYSVHVNVNAGCIRRTYYYHLDGSCSNILPVRVLDFSGSYHQAIIALNWQISASQDLRSIVIERKTSSGLFMPIGTLDAQTTTDRQQTYQYLDARASSVVNFYRLRFIYNNNSTAYSNILRLSKRQNAANIAVFPNPAREMVQVEFDGNNNHLYQVQLFNQHSQLVKQFSCINQTGRKWQIQRTPNMAAGIYFLNILDTETGEMESQKIIFQ
ncbi:MAG: hypothetical protein RLY16_1844 [Bacteroidota bacterium]